MGADPVGACGPWGGLYFFALSEVALWEASEQGRDGISLSCSVSLWT